MARANPPKYSVSEDNQIVTSRTSDVVTFADEAQLAKLAAEWPIARLMEIWNHLPGVRPVSKFTDRKTAVRRIWAAVHERKAPALAQPKSKVAKASASGTKTERVIALLRQPAGAALKEIIAATEWQSHSVRGFISGQLVKKLRLKVKSFKRDGERAYKIRS